MNTNSLSYPINHPNSGQVDLIKIWTRGQILAQKSTFSELPQIRRERSPHRHESNAIRFISNGRRERKIWRSVRKVKQGKKMLTVPVRTVRTATWKGRTIMLTWQLDDVSRFY